MVKLLGLLKYLPEKLILAMIFFVIGYGTCVYNSNISQKEAYIEQLKQTLKDKDERISSLSKTLVDINDEQLSLNLRIDRLQSTNAKLTAKLSDNSYRIANDQCRALLSECTALNGRSTEVQRQGIELVRDCERKLEAIKGLNSQ